MDSITLQSQPILLHSNYHKHFLNISKYKTTEKMAILNGDDDRQIVFNDDVLIEGDTAYIPISGVLYHSPNERSVKGFFTDYSFLHKQIQRVYTDDSIKQVVFNVDSPGGMCLGMSAIAKEIKELSLKKKTTAIVYGLCCSAAYMLSANCREIYATQGSFVGSIGVFTLIVDDKKYYENFGFKIYSVGKPHGKTLGRTGQEVTEEYLEKEQTRCDVIFEDIVDMVSSKVSREKIMELDAEAFTSQAALEHGLIDGILTAEETLTNTFPKEETMENENTTPTLQEQALQEQESKGENASAETVQTLDMQAFLSGISQAVADGIATGVANQNAQAPPVEQATPPEGGQVSLNQLPSGGLQAFQTGDQHFDSTNSNSPPNETSQQATIRACFNKLNQSSDCTEIFVNTSKEKTHV